MQLLVELCVATRALGLLVECHSFGRAWLTYWGRKAGSKFRWLPVLLTPHPLHSGLRPCQLSYERSPNP
ncbi:MAG: hypothetical protein EOO65_04840 [Methanosarcinales archaeon]|nr:MAG: hypothetical protein EOO65_04840 [Methanosarcinales archaeon]